MNKEISNYNSELQNDRKEICTLLATTINSSLPEAESKIWYSSPVWFLDGNPVVGYKSLKNDVQLLFWSGQSFDEERLDPEGSFKAAQKRYTSVDQISTDDLKRWLEKAKNIQWDYKNIVKRRGKLERIK